MALIFGGQVTGSCDHFKYLPGRGDEQDHIYLGTTRPAIALHADGGQPVGSGASRDFGREKTRWRTEDRQAANHECLISSHFSSLTGVTRSASEAELGLLSADAPEPVVESSFWCKCRSDFRVGAPSVITTL
jgi:hypothetical protein